MPNREGRNRRHAPDRLKRCLVLVTFAALSLAMPANANADAVADWNAIAVQATITGARPVGYVVEADVFRSHATGVLI